jgi:uncharacterized membrane protein YraQ (UPF0718 family)
MLVGLDQLPAEIAALGWTFAVVRNLSCFALSVAISFVMMLIFKLFGMCVGLGLSGSRKPFRKADSLCVGFVVGTFLDSPDRSRQNNEED